MHTCTKLKVLMNRLFLATNRKIYVCALINYIRMNVISRSTHLLQISRDAELSKKVPSPRVNLDGGHDLTNRCTHFGPWTPLSEFSNSTDVIYGFAMTFKGPTIRMNNSKASTQKKSRTGSGTELAEVMRMYNAKLSHLVIPPTKTGMAGWRKMKLCMADNSCNSRYFIKLE